MNETIDTPIEEKPVFNHILEIQDGDINIHCIFDRVNQDVESILNTEYPNGKIYTR